MTIMGRFMQRVVKTRTCWLWTGAIYKRTGYGTIGINGKNVSVHRLAYELFVGPAGDLFVLHDCDVRHCVRPDHLFLGTQSDNIRDAYSKGRMVGNRRLTESQVEEIRRRYRRGNGQALATEFGISRTWVHKLVQGEDSVSA